METTVAILKKGKYWHYRFMMNGRRHCGSTKEVNKGRAQQFENALIARVLESGADALVRKSPFLEDYAKTFLAQCEREVQSGNLEIATFKYYRSGWKLLADTPIRKLRLNEISTHTASVLTFPGGPSNAMAAFRTLRRMLNSAVETRDLRVAPKIKGLEEVGRTTLIEPWMEKRLLAHAESPLDDVIVIMADTGMRPEEVMRMQLEDVLWDRSVIAVRKSKTSKKSGVRFVPLSERVHQRITARLGSVTDGWLFPSPRAASGHRKTVKHLWLRCVKAVNEDGGDPLPAGLVLYCGRHTFATDLLQETKNLKRVQDALGHMDIRTTMKYLHPDVGDNTELINARNRRREMKVVGKVG